MFRYLKFIKIAEDSTLNAKGKYLSCLASKFNPDLQKVVKWLRINRLPLSVCFKMSLVALALNSRYAQN